MYKVKHLSSKKCTKKAQNIPKTPQKMPQKIPKVPPVPSKLTNTPP